MSTDPETLVDVIGKTIGAAAVTEVVKMLPALTEEAQILVGQVRSFLEKNGLTSLIYVVSRAVGGPAAIRAELDATLAADYVSNDLSADVAEANKLSPPAK